MKKSSVFLLACAIALGSVGCGGSGNNGAPLTSRDVAVVGIVAADAWLPTVSSFIFVENAASGILPPERPGSSAREFQNLTFPISQNRRGNGLEEDQYTGYFYGFELQNPNTVLVKFYETDSVDSAVRGTGTIVRSVRGSTRMFTYDVNVPEGRRPLKGAFVWTVEGKGSTASYSAQYTLGTGAKTRVVAGDGEYSGGSLIGNMYMTHNGRTSFIPTILFNGSQFGAEFSINGISGDIQGTSAEANLRIYPTGSQPGIFGIYSWLTGDFTITPDGGPQGPEENAFDY